MSSLYYICEGIRDNNRYGEEGSDYKGPNIVNLTLECGHLT